MNRKPRLIIIPPQHLGHEIHVGRNIVVDMLSKGVLEKSSGDCIITGLFDRRFLYESFLGIDNIFDFSIIPGLEQPIRPPKNTTDYLNISSSFFNGLNQFRDFHVINLSNYSLPPTYCTYGTSEEMSVAGYTVPEKYWNEHFIEYARRFNFSTTEEINHLIPSELTLFIVIHHRYSASIEKLNAILNSLPVELTKIIFTSHSDELSKQLSDRSNLFFTENLKFYSTLLKDSRCKLLISEWSGAGQLAQYTLGQQGGVWYYYDHYPDVFNFTMTHKIWELNAKLGNYFNCWDFKNISGCSISHFPSFDKLIASCMNIKITHVN
jgi:hypothetical protein